MNADSEDSDQTGRMPGLICLRWAHSHFVGFIMRRLKCDQSMMKTRWSDSFKIASETYYILTQTRNVRFTFVSVNSKRMQAFHSNVLLQ